MHHNTKTNNNRKKSKTGPDQSRQRFQSHQSKSNQNSEKIPEKKFGCFAQRLGSKDLSPRPHVPRNVKEHRKEKIVAKTIRNGSLTHNITLILFLITI